MSLLLLLKYKPYLYIIGDGKDIVPTAYKLKREEEAEKPKVLELLESFDAKLDKRLEPAPAMIPLEDDDLSALLLMLDL